MNYFMDPSSLILLFKNPVIKKICETAGKYSYQELCKNYTFYRFLNELGIERPKDEHQRLYLHTTVLFAAKGKQREFIELILLPESQAAFREEVQEEKSGAFLLQLDSALHTHRLVKEIKHWNEIPFADVEDFFNTYRSLVKTVATPVQNAILSQGTKQAVLIEQNKQISIQGFQALSDQMAGLTDMLTNGPGKPLQEEYNRQLKVIIETLSEGKVRRALEELLVLKEQLWEKLDGSLRFRLLTNLGVCNFRLEAYDQAAEFLIEAFPYNPGSATALNNLVNAYMFTGDEVQAQRNCALFIESFPENPEAYSAWIKLNSPELSLEELKEKVPDFLQNHPVILTALGLAVRKRNEYDLSIGLLKQAMNAGAADEFICEHLIQTYLDKYSLSFQLINLGIPDEKTTPELEEMLGLIRKQLSATDEAETPGMKAKLYLAEGFTLNLLQRPSEALSATSQGLALEPENLFLIKQKAILLAYDGDADAAITLLQPVERFYEVPDVPLFLAEVCHNVGRTTEAISTLEAFTAITSDGHFLEQSKHILVDYYILEKQDNKLSLLSATAFSEETITNKISLAKIGKYHGEMENVVAILRQGLGLVTAETRFRDKYLLAEICNREQLVSEAVTLYETINEPGAASAISASLIRLYQKLGRLKDALAALRLIREKNGPVKGFTESEVYILCNYLSDYRGAAEVAAVYVARFPENMTMILQLNGLYLRLEEFEKADAFLDEKIAYWNLDAQLFQIYLLQLTSRRKEQQVYKIAYEYRRLKDDQQAHTAYLQTLLQVHWPKEGDSTPKTVALDTVVTLTDKSGYKFFLTIEDRPSSELKAGEVNAEHPRFTAIIGKTTGEIVQFEGSFTKWTVTAIEKKYTFAFHESQQKTATIYAETSPLKVFHTDDFPELMGQLYDPQYAGNFQTAVDLYKNHSLTLGFFAQRFDKNPLELWGQLRSIPDCGIRTCRGEPGSLNASAAQLKNSPRICADVLGIATLFELPVADLVIKHFGKLLITESTYDTLLDFVRLAIGFGAHENGDSRAERLLAFVKSNTETVQPQKILQMNSLEKGHFDDLIGKSFYESVLLAEEMNAVLYTEDAILRLVAQSEHQVAGCWSQSLLFYFLGEKLIDRDMYENGCLTLATMNYRHTYISGGTLVAAVKQHGADTGFMIRLLTILHGNNTSIESVPFVVYGFITNLWTGDLGLSDSEKEELTFLSVMALLTDRTVIQAATPLQRLALLTARAMPQAAARLVYAKIAATITHIRRLFDLDEF